MADCKRYDSLRRPKHGKITGAVRDEPAYALLDDNRLRRDHRHSGRLPCAGQNVDELTFEDKPVNETLVRDLASGDFLDQQRNDRVDRRYRNRQVASRGKYRTILHQTGQEGSVFQCGRPREQA